MGPRAGRVGVPPWTDLLSNRILYIPSSFGPLGTLKNSMFFFNSSSYSGCTPAMKLTCSTIHPGCCIVLLSVDLKDTYRSSATHLALTTYRLTSDMTLNSIKEITHDMVFVGILNAIPSGLLFYSLSSVILVIG